MQDASHDQDQSELSQSSYPNMGFEGDAEVGQSQTYPVDRGFDGGWNQATDFGHYPVNDYLPPASTTPASATGGYGSTPSNPTVVGQRNLVFDSPIFNHLPLDRGLVSPLDNTEWTRSSSNTSHFPWSASQNNNTAFDGFGQFHDNTLAGGVGTWSPGLHQQLTDFSFVNNGASFMDNLTNINNNLGLSQAFSEPDYLQGFRDPLLDPSFGYATSDTVGSATGWATMNSFQEPSMTGSHSQFHHLLAGAEGSFDIQQNYPAQIGSNTADYYGNDHSIASTQTNIGSLPNSQNPNTASVTHRRRLRASRLSNNNVPATGIRNGAHGLMRCAYPPCTKRFNRNYERVRHEDSVHRNNQGAHLCPIAGCDKSQGNGYSRADKVIEHLWKKHADLGYVKA
ncbi:hypothetical protein EG329_008716 [Mollisiaceae sp. DMI_Dod_QoI]|nr:hypothetical protein EG329_008716 [Helotiales sp. DMI_Dod_QoI]